MTGTFTPSRWIAFTFLGWLLGIVLIIVLSGLFDLAGIEGYQSYVGLGTGAGVGLTQWLLLRKRSGIGVFWLWSTVVGMGLPFVFIDVLHRFIAWDNNGLQLILSVIFGGIATGIIQASGLNSTQYGRQWVVRCSLGWTLSVTCVILIDYVKLFMNHNLILFFVNLALILSGGIALGAVTGTTIIKICKESYGKNTQNLSQGA